MKNMRNPSAAILVACLVIVLVSLVPVHAVTYTITLQTDRPSYSGTQQVKITGTVSPSPGPNTNVFIVVKNQNGSVVDVDSDAVNATTGAFSKITVPGGSASWVAGTYSVNATWGGNGATASKTITFTYSPTTTTTTTTTSTSTTTTSTTATTSSAIPEFPSGSLAVIALAAVMMVAVLSKRLSLR